LQLALHGSGSALETEGELLDGVAFEPRDGQMAQLFVAQRVQKPLKLFGDLGGDIHWTLDEQIAEGNKVVSRFTWTGTHRGPFLGIAPTGQRLQVWGVVSDVIRGGQFVESRIIMDTLGLMRQLGAIPGAAG
jgi:hypothetical protein